MHITSTIIKSKALEGSVSSSNSTQSSASSTSSTSSFKDELETVKAQETSETTSQTEETAQSEEARKTAETKTTEETKATETSAEEETNKTTTQEETDKSKEAIATKTSLDNIAQQIEKNKIANKLEKKNSLKETKETDPVEELSSKIAKVNEIKNNSNHIQATAQKAELTTDCTQSINMDNQDITFFVNLAQNQNTSAQGVQINSSGATFTDIKTEATQQTVQVSSTLMSALDESMKTNKPFRIDFGGDVAVIMKVDKDGVLSANFIPGNSAVEAYLKNNISSLKQSFDDQELPYNQLSYSDQQKQKQKQGNNKENKDE